MLTYYKKYSKILSTVIKEAKKLNYADKIKKAPNKNKTIWNIINIESNKTDSSNTNKALNINGTLINDGQKMANEFSEYFSSIARNITTKLNKHSPDKSDNMTPSHYLLQSFQNSFPNFTLKIVSTNEIKNIIKSLKSKNSSGYDGISTKLIKKVLRLLLHH